MAHWLTVQFARLLAHQGASTCIMTGTMVGAAIGAAALASTATAPVHGTPTAVTTPAAPPAAPSPCTLYVDDGQHACGGWFHHRGHHFGQFGHGRHGRAWGGQDDWGSGFWPSQSQPTPLAPTSPNGGTINAPVNSTQGFGM